MITLEQIFTWVREERPFALARYGDGELRLMQNRGLPQTQDNWTAPAGSTRLGEILRESFAHHVPGFIRGIPNCTNCTWVWGRDLFKLAEDKTTDGCTCACVFIHERYPVVCSWMEQLSQPVHLVAHESARLDLMPFDVAAFHPVTCIDPTAFIESDAYHTTLHNLITLKGALILMSCGPIANAIAWQGWQHNQSNVYLDMGSSMDELVHGRITRPFMYVADWSRRLCRFGDVKLF